MIPSSIAGRQRWVAWLVGVFLGMAGAVSLAFAGTIGILVVAVGIVLIAWRGPRIASIAGFLLGFGGLFTVLFARVKATCEALTTMPGDGCATGNTDLYLLGSVALLAAGLVASFRALQTRRQSGRMRRS